MKKGRAISWALFLSLLILLLDGQVGCRSKEKKSPQLPTVLSVPLPPPVPGCFRRSKTAPNTAKDAGWRTVPCLSAEEASHIPHPTLGGGPGTPGIQSPTVTYAKGRYSAIAGLIAGWVSVGFPDGSWSETDSQTGNTSFSVQTNTNSFLATCHSSNPALVLQTQFGPDYGGCVKGDNAQIQFTYQTSKWAQTQDSICVWNVDQTLQLYYFPQTWTSCTNVERAGFWPQNESVGIEGIVNPSTHLATVIADLPWSTEWISVSAPDWFGACWKQDLTGSLCPWNQVSGSMYGYGNSSQAVFGPNTSLQTTVGASTCTASIQVCNFLLFPPYDPYGGVSSANTAGGTQETNNLSTYYFQFPNAVCSNTTCAVTYTATN